MSEGRRFVIVDATPHDCPYLPGQTARLPLRLPRGPITPTEFDRLLAQGDRRAGRLLYRTQCRSCQACEALRLPLARFVPTKSHRRVLRRNEDVRIEVGAPLATPRHLELYNRHKFERGLSQTEGPISVEEYRRYYIDTCVQTEEIRYLVGDRLIAVSLLDVGQRSASSVYHYFDPDESRRSPGVYSVLREIELCKERGFDWYYLGLWVGACASLAYKSQYYPHQRRQAGLWHTFEAPGADEA